MKNNIKNYFYFTRTERNSAVWLAAITLVLLLAPQLHHYLCPTSGNPSITELKISESTLPHPEITRISAFEFDPNTATQEELAELGLTGKLINTILKYRSKGGKFRKPEDFRKIWGLSASEYQRLEPYLVIGSKKQTFPNDDMENQHNKTEPFTFDPNTASQDSLQLVGIPSKIAAQIIHYREKGGKFKGKTDLKKIYSFPEVLYDELEPYIKISTIVSPTWTENKHQRSQKVYSGNIEINSATFEKWMELPGVGPTIASKIVRFREKLGGFTSVEQLRETYGLQDSVFQKIRKHLILNQGVQKININAVNLEVLSAHPYCRYQHAKLIIKYRDMHNGIKNEAEMHKIYGIREVLPKLLPYLSYQ